MAHVGVPNWRVSKVRDGRTAGKWRMAMTMDGHFCVVIDYDTWEEAIRSAGRDQLAFPGLIHVGRRYNK